MAWVSISLNVLIAVDPKIARGIVKPTINWRPAHWVFLPKFKSFVVPASNNLLNICCFCIAICMEVLAFE